jgi:hypothetical protein
LEPLYITYSLRPREVIKESGQSIAKDVENVWKQAARPTGTRLMVEKNGNSGVYVMLVAVRACLCYKLEAQDI